MRSAIIIVAIVCAGCVSPPFTHEGKSRMAIRQDMANCAEPLWKEHKLTMDTTTEDRRALLAPCMEQKGYSKDPEVIFPPMPDAASTEYAPPRHSAWVDASAVFMQVPYIFVRAPIGLFGAVTSAWYDSLGEDEKAQRVWKDSKSALLKFRPKGWTRSTDESASPLR